MFKLKGYRATTWVWVGVMLVLTTACAAPWRAASGHLASPEWSVIPPQGWMHLSMADSEIISKNGPYLEFIMVQMRPLTQRFRFTKQVLNAGMLPHEAARLITDNLESDPLIRNFRLLASEPAMVAERPGFKLIYSYRDQHGVVLKTIYYGVLLPNRFFNIRYTGAQRHYFDQELPAFNDVLHSLRFLSS
ncbi:hypothetical protein DSCA_15230 [Desulfosarcina alkanivorans]|uniref:PsbP C-terminal domain-containing protein n=1 Tax=Desulfosarcina alkanivorans TaxID=571177 RepID=A0A5K7YG99_9BACT|nr:hypothetical protein [Desulfosarcina alkanivorans]BBO67593.1 hypothetical protein DSCA_15230 [Desulfosarcina alkanivorans]